LPAGRRRKLIALSQVPWFEEAVQKESRHRAEGETGEARIVEHEKDPYIPMMAKNLDLGRGQVGGLDAPPQLGEGRNRHLELLRALEETRTLDTHELRDLVKVNTEVLGQILANQERVIGLLAAMAEALAKKP